MKTSNLLLIGLFIGVVLTSYVNALNNYNISSISGNINVSRILTDDPNTNWGEYSYQYRFLSGGSGEFSMQVYLDVGNDGVFDTSEAITGAIQAYAKWYDGSVQADKFPNQIGGWYILRNDSQRVVITANGNDTVQNLTYDLMVEFFNDTDVPKYSVRVRATKDAPTSAGVRNLYSSIFAYNTSTIDYVNYWNLTDYKTLDMRNNQTAASVAADTTTSSGSGLGLNATWNKYHIFMCTSDGKSFGSLNWNQRYDAYQIHSTNWNNSQISPDQIERLNGTNLSGMGVNFPQEFYGVSSFRGNTSRDTIGLATATNNNIKINSNSTTINQIGVTTGFFYVFNYTNGCGNTFTQGLDPVSRDAQGLISYNRASPSVAWLGSNFRKLFDRTNHIYGIGVDPLWMNALSVAKDYTIGALKSEILSQASDLIRFQVQDGSNWWETNSKNYTARGAFWQNYRNNQTNPNNPQIESWYLGQGANGFLLTLYDNTSDENYLNSAANISYYWQDAHWNDTEGNFYWHGGAEVGNPSNNFSRWTSGEMNHRLNTHLFAIQGMIGTYERLSDSHILKNNISSLIDSGLNVVFNSNSTWYLDRWINESTGTLVEEYKQGSNYSIVDNSDNYYGVELSILGKLPEYSEKARTYIRSSNEFEMWMNYSANTTMQTSGLTVAQQQDRDMQIARGLAMLSRYKPNAVTLIPKNILKNQSSTKPLTYTLYTADKSGIRGYSYYGFTNETYIYNTSNMLNWSTLVTDVDGLLEFALISFDENIFNETVYYSTPSSWNHIWDSTNNRWLSTEANGTYQFNLSRNESYIVAIGSFAINDSGLTSLVGNITMYSTVNNKTFDYDIEVSQLLNESVGYLEMFSTYDNSLVGYRNVNIDHYSSNTRSIISSLNLTTDSAIIINTEGVVPSSPFVVYPNGSTFYITDYVYDSSSGTFAYNDSVPPGSSYLHLNSVDPTVYDICSSGQSSLFELSNWLSIFGLLVGALFVLGVLSSFGFVDLNIPTEFFTIDNLAGIGLMLVGAAITISVGAQIIASALC